MVVVVVTCGMWDRAMKPRDTHMTECHKTNQNCLCGQLSRLLVSPWGDMWVALLHGCLPVLTAGEEFKHVPELSCS